MPSAYGVGTYGQSSYGGIVTASASTYSISKFGDTTVYSLSKVNRKFSKGYVRFGREQQLGNGNWVRDITAVKRTFTFHWDNLPHLDSDTLDGGIGYVTLYSLYRYGIQAGENNGKLTLSIPDGNGGQETVTCYIGQSTKAQISRIRNSNSPSKTAYWSVDLQLVEV